jgi:hypothetical protein
MAEGQGAGGPGGSVIATVFLGALLAANSPNAAVQPPPVAATAQQRQLAARLVRILNSEALTRTQLIKMLDETLPKTLSTNPTFAELERDYPGISKGFLDAMRPIILEGTLSRMPTLWARLEPIYTRSFTEAELQALLAFYTSPTGTRIIDKMGRGSDFSQMLGNVIASDDKRVTVKDMQAGIQTGIAEVVRSSSDEDIAAIKALNATSAGAKLPAVNQQVQAEAAAWGNEADPEMDTKIEEAVKAVVAKYIGKTAQ